MKLLLITRDPTKRLISDYTAALNKYTGNNYLATQQISMYIGDSYSYFTYTLDMNIYTGTYYDNLSV